MIPFSLVLATLLLLLGFIPPDEVKLPIYLLVFSIVYILFTLFGLTIARLAYPKTSYQRKFFVSLVAAFCPLTLMALSTMSTISAIDLFLTFLVPMIVIWYGLKRI